MAAEVHLMVKSNMVALFNSLSALSLKMAIFNFYWCMDTFLYIVNRHKILFKCYGIIINVCWQLETGQLGTACANFPTGRKFGVFSMVICKHGGGELQLY